MQNQGLLFVFEGVDGCGKTSLLAALANRLKSVLNNPNQLVITREPGGCFLSEKIRNWLLEWNWSPPAQALLYATSRCEHYYQTIMPALVANKLVLCDRFILSSLVYQGYWQKLGIEAIKQLNHFGIGAFWPHYTFYCQIHPQIAFKRLQNRTNDTTVQQQTSLQLQALCLGYEQLIQTYPFGVCCLNANLTLETVCNDAWFFLTKVLTQHVYWKRQINYSMVKT